MLLQNKNLELHIDLPLENYGQARFDWTGKIRAVKYKGKYVSGVEITDHPEGQFCGAGFYNEFGIDTALGFGETKEGEWFHKIGIGLLQKEGASYQFHKAYKIRPAHFKVESTADRISIRCQAPLVNGYAYLLEKEIKLLANGFEIQYQLKNTGQKSIITDEYNHNFLAINQNLMGKDYILKFPFPIQAQDFGESVNPENKVEIGSDSFQFKDTPKEQFFFSNLSGGQLVKAYWQLENTKAQIGIAELGSFQTSKINLWGWRHVISPELFYPINIKPGQKAKWTRSYTVYKMD